MIEATTFVRRHAGKVRECLFGPDIPLVQQKLSCKAVKRSRVHDKWEAYELRIDGERPVKLDLGRPPQQPEPTTKPKAKKTTIAK